MKGLKILNYNIGHLYIFQPRKHIPTKNANKVFFNKKDLPFIQSIVQKTNPDIIFFQETTSLNDAKILAQLLNFKFYSFFKTAHLKKQQLGTSILHNLDKAKVQKQSGILSIHSLILNQYIFSNLHLNPFSKTQRYQQIKQLNLYIKQYPKHQHIIAGDFNFSRRKKRRINQTDKKSYNTITNILEDATTDIDHTHTLGFKFDYLFHSNNIKIKEITAIPQTQRNMDHYPLITKLNLNNKLL